MGGRLGLEGGHKQRGHAVGGFLAVHFHRIGGKRVLVLLRRRVPGAHGRGQLIEQVVAGHVVQLGRTVLGERLQVLVVTGQHGHLAAAQVGGVRHREGEALGRGGVHHLARLVAHLVGARGRVQRVGLRLGHAVGHLLGHDVAVVAEVRVELPGSVGAEHVLLQDDLLVVVAVLEVVGLGLGAVLLGGHARLGVVVVQAVVVGVLPDVAVDGVGGRLNEAAVVVVAARAHHEVVGHERLAADGGGHRVLHLHLAVGIQHRVSVLVQHQIRRLVVVVRRRRVDDVRLVGHQAIGRGAVVGHRLQKDDVLVGLHQLVVAGKVGVLAIAGAGQVVLRAEELVFGDARIAHAHLVAVGHPRVGAVHVAQARRLEIVEAVGARAVQIGRAGQRAVDVLAELGGLRLVGIALDEHTIGRGHGCRRRVAGSPLRGVGHPVRAIEVVALERDLVAVESLFLLDDVAVLVEGHVLDAVVVLIVPQHAGDGLQGGVHHAHVAALDNLGQRHLMLPRAAVAVGNGIHHDRFHVHREPVVGRHAVQRRVRTNQLLGAHAGKVARVSKLCLILSLGHALAGHHDASAVLLSVHIAHRGARASDLKAALGRNDGAVGNGAAQAHGLAVALVFCEVHHAEAVGRGHVGLHLIGLAGVVAGEHPAGAVGLDVGAVVGQAVHFHLVAGQRIGIAVHRGRAGRVVGGLIGVHQRGAGIRGVRLADVARRELDLLVNLVAAAHPAGGQVVEGVGARIQVVYHIAQVVEAQRTGSHRAVAVAVDDILDFPVAYCFGLSRIVGDHALPIGILGGAVVLPGDIAAKGAGAHPEAQGTLVAASRAHIARRALLGAVVQQLPRELERRVGGLVDGLHGLDGIHLVDAQLLKILLGQQVVDQMGMAQREALPQVVGHVVPLGQRHGATGQAVLEGRLVDAVVGALALGAVEHRVAGGPLVAVGVVPHHIGDGGLGNLYEAAVAALLHLNVLIGVVGDALVLLPGPTVGGAFHRLVGYDDHAVGAAGRHAVLEGRVRVGIAHRRHGVLHIDEAVHQAEGLGGAVEGVQALGGVVAEGIGLGAHALGVTRRHHVVQVARDVRTGQGVAGDGLVRHLLVEVGRVGVGHGYGVAAQILAVARLAQLLGIGLLEARGHKVGAVLAQLQILLRVGAVGGGEGIVRVEHTVAVLVEAVGALPRAVRAAGLVRVVQVVLGQADAHAADAALALGDEVAVLIVDILLADAVVVGILPDVALNGSGGRHDVAAVHAGLVLAEGQIERGQRRVAVLFGGVHHIRRAARAGALGIGGGGAGQHDDGVHGMDVAVGAELLAADEREGLGAVAVGKRRGAAHVGLALGAPLINQVVRGSKFVLHRVVGGLHLVVARLEVGVAADGHGVAGQVLLAVGEHAHGQVVELVVAVRFLAGNALVAGGHRLVVEGRLGRLGRAPVAIVAVLRERALGHREPVVGRGVRLGVRVAAVGAVGIVVPLAQVQPRRAIGHRLLLGVLQLDGHASVDHILVSAGNKVVDAVLVVVVLPHVAADGAVGRSDLAHVAGHLGHYRMRPLVGGRIGGVHGVGYRDVGEAGLDAISLAVVHLGQDDLAVVGAHRAVCRVAVLDGPALVQGLDGAIGDVELIGVAGHARLGAGHVGVDGEPFGGRVSVGEAYGLMRRGDVPGVPLALHVAALQVVLGGRQLHAVGGKEVLVDAAVGVEHHHGRGQVVEDVLAVDHVHQLVAGGLLRVGHDLLGTSGRIGLHGHHAHLVAGIGTVLAVAHNRDADDLALVGDVGRILDDGGLGGHPVGTEADVLHPGTHGRRLGRIVGGLGAVSGDPFHETSVIAGLDLGEGRGALGHVVPLGGKHRFADKPLLVIGADAIGSRVVVGFGVVPHDAGDLGGRRLEETRVHVLALEHLVGHVVGHAFHREGVGGVGGRRGGVGGHDEASLLGQALAVLLHRLAIGAGDGAVLVGSGELRVARHDGRVVAVHHGRAVDVALGIRVGVGGPHRRGALVAVVEHREHVALGQVRLGQAVGRHGQGVVGSRGIAGRHRVAVGVELHVGQKPGGVVVVEGEGAIGVGLHGVEAGIPGDHGGRGAGGLVGHGLGDLVAEGRVLDPGAHDRVRVVAHQLDLVVLLAGERLGGTQLGALVVHNVGGGESHLAVGALRLAFALGHLGHGTRALKVEPLGELNVLALVR